MPTSIDVEDANESTLPETAAEPWPQVEVHEHADLLHPSFDRGEIFEELFHRSGAIGSVGVEKEFFP